MNRQPFCPRLRKGTKARGISCERLRFNSHWVPRPLRAAAGEILAARPREPFAQRLRAGLDRRLRRDPFEALQLMARPGELALGVVAGIEFCALGGFGEREFSFQMGDEMRHAVRAHDRQRGVEATLRERGDLVEPALIEHRVEAGLDPPKERVAVRGEEEAGPFARFQRRRRARALEGGERAAGGGEHFEGAQESAVGRRA